MATLTNDLYNDRDNAFERTWEDLPLDSTKWQPLSWRFVKEFARHIYNLGWSGCDRHLQERQLEYMDRDDFESLDREDEERHRKMYAAAAEETKPKKKRKR